MKVELIDCTNNALELLLYTKDTRLQGEQTLQDIVMWPHEKKLDHLAYMKDTIQSSWEFVNYTFHISEVTRAFTHQLVRTRTGSYAQQSMRTVDVSGADYMVPEFDNQVDELLYTASMNQSMNSYQRMIDEGIPIQDARGVLPTNIHTEIIAQFDLRTIHNMGLLRLCTRTQGEYQKVFKMMVDEIVKVHPWAEDFIKVHCAWYGVCAFPRYDKCPIQKYTLMPNETDKKEIEVRWGETSHEAVPVVNNGKTM